MAKEYEIQVIPTVQAALDQLTVDILKGLLNLLPCESKATRKADIVSVIAQHLQGEKLKALWETLDETQKQAVAETIYSEDGFYNGSRFQAKYGISPVFGTKTDGWSQAKPTVLRLLIHPVAHYGGIGCVPEDLRKLLTKFVVKPLAAVLPMVEELPDCFEREDTPHRWQNGGDSMTVQKSQVNTVQIPLVQRDTEGDALAEAVIMLRLVDQGKIAVSDKTNLPGTVVLRELGNALSRGDYYPPSATSPDGEDGIGQIKAFAWPLLIQSAGLVELHGKKLALTKTGRNAIGKNGSEIVRGIWQRWVKGKQFDEFNRIDTIKGQTGKGKRSMTAATSRRVVIEKALRQCPQGAWIKFDDFSRYLKASGHDFEITSEPWSLYIADSNYGSLGHAGFHSWAILQKRYLACLLFEYAATLGLVDIAYVDPWEATCDFSHLWGIDDLNFLSRYDGLVYFRLNPLGAFCLGLADKYQPTRLETKTLLQVLPNLHISVVSEGLSLEESLFLDTWAERSSGTFWRLDRSKILQAIERGQRIAELRDFLAARDGQGLPVAVESFLNTTVRQAEALKSIGTVLLIECADDDVAELIARHEQTKSLCQWVGPRRLAVKLDAEERFRQAVRDLGYGIARG